MQRTILVLALAATPALAQDPAGDAALGEAAFRQCQACHIVADAEGNVLAGRSGRIGPNLYGIAGRTAGSFADFRYSDGLKKLAEMAVVWDEEKFTAFVQDPTGFVKTTTGDGDLRSNMTFRLRKPEDAANLWAWLVSLAPAE